MNAYIDDLRLEKRFANSIKAQLGKYFIKQDFVADTEQATDFLVFTVKPIKVGARLRTFTYLDRYPNEFTVRWSRPSGVPTEIHKIRSGLVDYFFYGFVDPDEKKVVKYFIADLAVFRNHEPKPEIHPNNPHDSDLAAYKLSQLPANFILFTYCDKYYSKYQFAHIQRTVIPTITNPKIVTKADWESVFEAAR